MSIFRRWKQRGQRIIDAVTRNDREAKVYVKQITFSGGTTINLLENSILVIVGPNNAGKSSVLREIRDYLHDGFRFGPVLKNAEVRVKGNEEAFRKQIRSAGLVDEKRDSVQIGHYEYDLEKIEKDLEKGFVGSKIIPFFLSYLGTEGRLKISDPTRRGDYISGAPSNPIQWLELDESAEEKISKIFQKTFNAGLILNTVAGENLTLHVIRPGDEKENQSTTRAEAAWLASLPRLQKQGDGMRSFAGTILGLLVHPY